MRIVEKTVDVALLFVAGFSLINYIVRHMGLPTLISSSIDELLILILVLCYFAIQIANGKLSYHKNMLNAALLILLVAALLSIALNNVPLAVAVEGIRVLLQATAFYFLSANLISSRRQVKVLVTVMLAAVTLAALYGVYQFAIGLETPADWVYREYESSLIKTRVYSILGNPNALGGYLVLFLPLALALFLKADSQKSRIIYGLASLVMLLCLLFTYSRGAWIGFAFSFIVLALLIDRRLLIVFALGMVLTPLILPESFVYRLVFAFSSEYVGKSMEFGRLHWWLISIQKMIAHPFAGVGLGTFGDTVAIKFNMPGATWVDNHFLKLGAEMGITGLLAFLFTIFSALLTGIKGAVSAKDRYNQAVLAGITAGMTGVAVQNLTASIWEVLIVAVYFWFLAGILVAVRHLEPARQERK